VKSDFAFEFLRAKSQKLIAAFRGLMPKLKTHKGAAKRFKKTGTGKVKRGHSGLRHILTSKAKKRKRKLGKSTLVSDGDLLKVKRMIPY
jgi:large subunit ribosomal protein L35